VAECCTYEAWSNSTYEDGKGDRVSMGLFGGGKVEALRKRSLELSQDMGKQPTVAEIKQLEEVLEELCDAGYWPAHESIARLYGKRIWATLDFGQSSMGTVSPDKRAEITKYATLGLLHLKNFCEKEGKKIDPRTLESVEAFRQEFAKYLSKEFETPNKGEVVVVYPDRIEVVVKKLGSDPSIAATYPMSEIGGIYLEPRESAVTFYLSTVTVEEEESERPKYIVTDAQGLYDAVVPHIPRSSEGDLF
jgi:hypothetical protein